MEGVGHGRDQPVRRDLGHRHVDLVGLAAIAHVAGSFEANRIRAHPFPAQLPVQIAFERLVDLLEGRRRGRVRVHQPGDDIRVLHIGQQHPQSREYPGLDRHEDALDAEILGDQSGVERARASEGQQREVARIPASLDRDRADADGHSGDLNPDDGHGRLGRVHPQGSTDMFLDCAARGVHVQAHLAAREIRRIDVAKRHGRVGTGRLHPALAIADRTRIRARAFRTDLESAPDHPGDAAAARAYGVDVDLRHLHRIGADLAFGRESDLTAAHEADVEAGAAHVHGDDIVEPRRPGHPDRAHDPARGTGEQGVHRMTTRGGDAHQPAVGLHYVELAGAADLAEQRFQPLCQTVDPRHHIGVHDRRRRPFVLAKLGRDVGGDGDQRIGTGRADGVAQSSLVRRVEKGEQAADRHRLETALGDQPGDALSLLVGQGGHDLAPGADALFHLEAPAPRHQRRRLLDVEVEEAAAPKALDLDDVARAPGRDKGGLGALALEHRIRRHRGPEDETADPGGVDSVAIAQALDPGQHGPRRIFRHRGQLEGRDRSRPGVQRNEVSEGAAGIDAQIVHAPPPSPAARCQGLTKKATSAPSRRLSRI